MMDTLKKANIVSNLIHAVSLPKVEAKLLVDNFFELIRANLESGQHVKLSGFGNFMLRDKSQRPGRNPKTGEWIPVTARRVVTFKIGLKLKHKIEQIEK